MTSARLGGIEETAFHTRSATCAAPMPISTPSGNTRPGDAKRGWRGLPSHKKRELAQRGIDSRFWNATLVETAAPQTLKDRFQYAIRRKAEEEEGRIGQRCSCAALPEALPEDASGSDEEVPSASAHMSLWPSTADERVFPDYVFADLPPPPPTRSQDTAQVPTPGDSPEMSDAPLSLCLSEVPVDFQPSQSMPADASGESDDEMAHVASTPESSWPPTGEEAFFPVYLGRDPLYMREIAQAVAAGPRSRKTVASPSLMDVCADAADRYLGPGAVCARAATAKIEF